jgi:hypothetical protein
MNKAIVIEVSTSHLIVLAEGGEFKKIKNNDSSYQVGQEISIPPPKVHKKDYRYPFLFTWKAGTAVALAVILFFFQIFSPTTDNGVYAFVGMDMDPSLELKINENMQVLDVKAYNEEGRQVLQMLHEWKKKEISYVTDLIFEYSEMLGYLDDKEEVLITTTLSEDIPENKEKELKQRINQVMSDTAEKKAVQMTAIVVSKKEREEAKRMKLTPGHYAIYKAAKKAGKSISKKEAASRTLEEISEEVGPIHELLKDSEAQEFSSEGAPLEHKTYEPPLPVLDERSNKGEQKKNRAQEQVNSQSAGQQTSLATERKKEDEGSSETDADFGLEKNGAAAAMVLHTGSDSKSPIKIVPMVSPLLNVKEKTAVDIPTKKAPAANEDSNKTAPSQEQTISSDPQALIESLVDTESAWLTVTSKAEQI